MIKNRKKKKTISKGCGDSTLLGTTVSILRKFTGKTISTLTVRITTLAKKKNPNKMFMRDDNIRFVGFA